MPELTLEQAIKGERKAKENQGTRTDLGYNIPQNSAECSQNRETRSQATAKDYWTADSSAFVIGKQKFVVRKDGKTVCLPLESQAKELPSVKVTTTPSKANKLGLDTVSKLLDGEILLPTTENSQNGAVMKHPGGRPQKEGEVSRVTAWRREKEKQGVLI